MFPRRLHKPADLGFHLFVSFVSLCRPSCPEVVKSWVEDDAVQGRTAPPTRPPSTVIPAGGRLPFPSVDDSQVKLKSSGERVESELDRSKLGAEIFLFPPAERGGAHAGLLQSGGGPPILNSKG